MFLFTYRSPSVYPLFVDTDPPVMYRYTYEAAEEPPETEGSDMTNTDIQSSHWVDIHGRTVNVQAVEMSDGQWKHFVFWHQEQADGSVICETHPTALTLREPRASQLADVISCRGGAYEFRPFD